MDSHGKRFDHYQTSAGKSGMSYRNSPNDGVDNLPILRDYNTIINDTLASFIILSRQIGGELSVMIDHVIRLFDAQREFIRYALRNRKPTYDQQIAELIKPQSNEIEAIGGK
jgi:hypothetical protein